MDPLLVKQQDFKSFDFWFSMMNLGIILLSFVGIFWYNKYIKNTPREKELGSYLEIIYSCILIIQAFLGVIKASDLLSLIFNLLYVPGKHAVFYCFAKLLLVELIIILLCLCLYICYVFFNTNKKQ